MWPLGHAAVGYLLYSLSAERTRVPELRTGVLVALLFGTQLPDVVDKPLAWELSVLPAGRSLAHSLFVVLPLVAIAIGATQRFDRPALGVAFGLGVLSHVVVDTVPALWLGLEHAAFLIWPLVELSAYEGSVDVLELFRNSLSQPWFLLEFVLAACALLRWRQDGLPGLSWVLSRREERQSTTEP